MTRVDEFIQDVSFSQLVDEATARSLGYNARTWNKAIESGYVFQDSNGYFSLKNAGRRRLNLTQDEKTTQFIGSFLRF